MESVALSDTETWADDFGLVVRVHATRTCHGEFCTIHNPSDHALSIMPQVWDSSRKVMMRKCVHENFHVDVDEPNYESIGCFYVCDGCCKPKD